MRRLPDDTFVLAFLEKMVNVIHQCTRTVTLVGRRMVGTKLFCSTVLNSYLFSYYLNSYLF